ncbi:hypothetical protein ACU8KH_03681 [Lachancea thermotolerans]
MKFKVGNTYSAGYPYIGFAKLIFIQVALNSESPPSMASN